MIPLLSCRMPLEQVRKQLGSSRKSAMLWLLAFRHWLLQLDPSGRREAQVQIGKRVAPLACCRRCGFEGGFARARSDSDGRRRVSCPQCGHSRQLESLQKEGQALDAVVVRDVVGSAVLERARRATLTETSKHEAAPMARVGMKVMMASAPQLPRLRDIALPVRRRRAGPPERYEDLELSAFLLKRIDAVLSASTTPDLCPWCGSAQTEYRSTKRLGSLPGFLCRSCEAHFTRASNTPLTDENIRADAWRLVPMLAWQESAEAAAHELGVSVSLLAAWLRTWRRWLLLLDPSGAMEARMSLGLRPQIEPSGLVEVSAGGCSRKAKADRPAGPKRLPSEQTAGMATTDVWPTASQSQDASPRRVDELAAWKRVRARERDRWLSRSWRKNTAGESVIKADGFTVKIIKMGAAAWRFEAYEGRSTEISQAGDGCRSSEAARLAAFDAITNLLLPQTERTTPVSDGGEHSVRRTDESHTS